MPRQKAILTPEPSPAAVRAERAARKRCKHCWRLRRIHRRDLCRECFDRLEIRVRYPPAAPRGNRWVRPPRRSKPPAAACRLAGTSANDDDMTPEQEREARAEIDRRNGKHTKEAGYAQIMG